jgi:hypothetical protein
MGGTIMGTGAANSVVNSYGQTHEIPNLYVAGPGIFTTSGASNPTYTIFALSLRGAEQLSVSWLARSRDNLAVDDRIVDKPRRWRRGEYEIVEVRTSRGVSRVMLFSNAIIEARRRMHRHARRWLSRGAIAGPEGEAGSRAGGQAAAYQVRNASAIKRERSRAKRAESIARPSSRAGAAVHVPGAGPASRRPHPW